MGTSVALIARVRKVIGKRVGARDESDPEARVIELTPRARQVLERAGYEAARAEIDRVTSAHILLAVSSVGVGEGPDALKALQIFPAQPLEVATQTPEDVRRFLAEDQCAGDRA
jgi:hypothetical protein